MLYVQGFAVTQIEWTCWSDYLDAQKDFKLFCITLI